MVRSARTNSSCLTPSFEWVPVGCMGTYPSVILLRLWWKDFVVTPETSIFYHCLNARWLFLQCHLDVVLTHCHVRLSFQLKPECTDLSESVTRKGIVPQTARTHLAYPRMQSTLCTSIFIAWRKYFSARPTSCVPAGNGNCYTALCKFQMPPCTTTALTLWCLYSSVA